jgi:aldose 1-epimerase
MPIPDDDEVLSLEHGRYRCGVDPSGATLRFLTADQEDLVERSPGTPDDIFRGAVLAPWPNRVAGGSYRFGGEDYQLPINEPARGHALHGVAFGLTFDVVEATPTRVRLAADVPASQGWPFPMRLAVSYELDDDGLTIRLVGTNTGDVDLPYGCGIHPYLLVGDGRVDEAELRLPAATRIEVDEVLIPVGTAPVEQVSSDFRVAATIGDRFFDHCFTDVGPADSDGLLRAVLQRPGHTGVELVWGDWAGWVQVYTSVRDDPAESRRAVAVEPMSCPPDSFNSGVGLVVLSPGDRHVAWWRIGQVPADR